MVKDNKAAKKQAQVEIKAGKHFRLESKYKRILGSVKDAHERGAWKRMFIEAQLAEQQAGMTGRKGYLEMFKGGV